MAVGMWIALFGVSFASSEAGAPQSQPGVASSAPTTRAAASQPFAPDGDAAADAALEIDPLDATEVAIDATKAAVRVAGVAGEESSAAAATHAKTAEGAAQQVDDAARLAGGPRVVRVDGVPMELPAPRTVGGLADDAAMVADDVAKHAPRGLLGFADEIGHSAKYIGKGLLAIIAGAAWWFWPRKPRET